jgi:hypothetical protein
MDLEVLNEARDHARVFLRLHKEESEDRGVERRCRRNP